MAYTEYSWMTDDEVMGLALSQDEPTQFEIELCVRLAAALTQLELEEDEK